MGSKFGFADTAKRLEVAERQFLKGGIELAKQEFDRNYQNANDPGDEGGTGGSWDPLRYRNEPPPILQLTGEMRRQTNSSPIQFGSHFALFTIDPRDKRGRGYAAYHHTGTSKMAARRTVVQSQNLDNLQLNLLIRIVDTVFDRQGYFS